MQIPFPSYVCPMTMQEANFYLLNQLRGIYPDGEATAMTDWVMENLTGSKKAERMIYKNAAITTAEEIRLQEITQRLLQHEPLQYVLNESFFCGLRFYVNDQVLIPRPETEELVEWVIAHCKFPVDALKILDIGTGSGCIAISLKRRIRKAEVWACDRSATALEVAARNAASLGTEVRFQELDFLDPVQRNALPVFDIIISNPPYVPLKDKASMNPNVLEHEPATALFVPDHDPLIFYKAIADFSQAHLSAGGTIFTEIHEDLGQATEAIFRDAGFTTELKKDMQGKNRMIRSEREVVSQ